MASPLLLLNFKVCLGDKVLFPRESLRVLHGCEGLPQLSDNYTPPSRLWPPGTHNGASDDLVFVLLGTSCFLPQATYQP